MERALIDTFAKRRELIDYILGLEIEVSGLVYLHTLQMDGRYIGTASGVTGCSVPDGQGFISWHSHPRKAQLIANCKLYESGVCQNKDDLSAVPSSTDLLSMLIAVISLKSSVADCIISNNGITIVKTLSGFVSDAIDAARSHKRMRKFKRMCVNNIQCALNDVIRSPEPIKTAQKELSIISDPFTMKGGFGLTFIPL